MKRDPVTLEIGLHQISSHLVDILNMLTLLNEMFGNQLQSN